MRKLMQVDSDRRELHNIGIGIIGVRIGLRPELGLEEVLTGRNVKSVQLIAADPPGLFIELRRLPGIVVAAEFDEDGRPRSDLAYYRRLVNPAELARSARAGRAIIGNIDYFLDPGQVEHFCRHFADTATEYKTWLRALHAGARHRHN
ncbi:MAG TPA: hypothetical protein ENN51_00955 [candidate division WOR-3 bacterium]|uniref:Uncharacterized protein n=1 Tax=candidate division WOR-3 bacterium TaxID=2052148 RepID=A0A7V0T425_UNCW3|nr:hypothetical protein [candidate division WOR-3 bacterium]